MIGRLALFAFSFTPEVWGTVSDWVIAAITAITAFYLYRTLKSQKEVQRTQTELFRIESIKFQESIKPVLRYTAKLDLFKPGDEGKRILTIEVSNETDSVALEISKIVAENEHTKQIFIPLGLDQARRHLEKGDTPLMFHFMIDSEHRFSDWLIFALRYQDISGTKYRQRVLCINDELGIEIHPHLPEVVNK